MAPELNNVLQDAIKISNHTILPALHSYLFTQLHDETEVERACLFLCTEARRLSKVDHWPEPQSYGAAPRFILEKQPPLAALLSDAAGLPDSLTYSACSVNSVFQGQMTTVLTSTEWMRLKPN